MRDLAERTAISEGQICNLQSGRRNPGAAMAAACDAALGAGCVLEADLGCFGQAADAFAVEVQYEPVAAADANSRARFAVRQATVHAGIGDIDGACETIAQVLPMLQRTDSATIRAELRRFLGQAHLRPGIRRDRRELDAVKPMAYPGL